MIQEKTHSISYKLLDFDDLGNDKELIERAKAAAKDAYAPYSNFQVGAAIQLSNGEVVIGSNQENAAFPSGLCAERVALFAASANFPNISFLTIAIYATSTDLEDILSPCGACRQVIHEYETKQNQVIKILISNSSDKVVQFEDSESLLPFAFKLKGLKKQ